MAWVLPSRDTVYCVSNKARVDAKACSGSRYARTLALGLLELTRLTLEIPETRRRSLPAAARVVPR